MAVVISLPPEPEVFTTEMDQSPESRFVGDVNRIIEKYLETYSSNTVGSYRNDMRTFFSVISKNIKDVNELDIIDYIKELERRGYKNASINRKVYSLSKIFSIYKKLGLVRRNIVKEVSKVSQINKKVNRIISLNIDLDDVSKVIEKSTKQTGLIVKALTNTGLRVSELINIKRDNIAPLNDGYLKVRINGKGSRERFIYLSHPLYAEIRNIFDGESEFLFHSKSGRKLSRINLYKQISRSFNRHAGKAASPHSLRHFFSTYKIGVEKKDVKSVSNYLGHSRVSITLEMYTHTKLAPEESHIL